MGWDVPRMMTGIDLSVLLAFVNVGVLGCGLRAACGLNQL